MERGTDVERDGWREGWMENKSRGWIEGAREGREHNSSSIAYHNINIFM